MSTQDIKIHVYAHLIGMVEPPKMGILTAQQVGGRKAFSFNYDKQWLKCKYTYDLDPDLSLFPGTQFPVNKENFGMILDSMTDTWGRTLMKRKAFQEAKDKNEKPQALYEIDFLLGVYDETRMGGLRFKLDDNGPFLNYQDKDPVPPIASLKELQHAIEAIESDSASQEIRKWLSILLAPGSSLGGARPKTNVIDEKNNFG